MNIAQTTQTLVSTICIGVCACFLSPQTSSGLCLEASIQRMPYVNQASDNLIYYTESAFSKLDSALTSDRMRYHDVRSSIEGFIEYLLENGSPLTAEENRSKNASIERLFKKTGRKIIL